MRTAAASAELFMKRLASAAFAAALMSTLISTGWSEETVRSKFGAWELRCETATGETSEQCGLTQTVNAEDKPNVNLGVIVVKPSEIKTAVLRVIAPLSVFLLNGVSLKIDQTDIGRTGFFRCFSTGCAADIPLDDKLIEQLKNGKIATLVIYLTPYEGLRHQVKLEGFKEGYAKLR